MPMNRPHGALTSTGFTLIELLVTITLLSILTALAMPSMTAWVRNNNVRTVGDSLQNGLRLAQAEAVRRSRQVAFSLTDSASPEAGANVGAVANGTNWSINALPSMSAGETSAFVQSGVLANAGAGVLINGPAAICFNSVGRLVQNTLPQVTDVTGGATCSVAAPPVYDITLTGADRPLRVVVALGGQVRMCDPNKTLSPANPDGC